MCVCVCVCICGVSVCELTHPLNKRKGVEQANEQEKETDGHTDSETQREREREMGGGGWGGGGMCVLSCACLWHKKRERLVERDKGSHTGIATIHEKIPISSLCAFLCTH